MAAYSDTVLYLIGGPNGSGKTTIAQSIMNQYQDIKFLNEDEIARENVFISNASAGRILLEKMEEVFSTHDSFIFETTLSGRFHNELIQRAHAAGYKIEFLYVVLSSVEQNLARVKKRVARVGHDVPENVVRRRHDKSLFNFDSVYKLVDSWKLYDNAGPEYKLIASGTGADINIVQPDIYSSFMEHKADVVSKYRAEIMARRASRIAKSNNLQK